MVKGCYNKVYTYQFQNYINVNRNKAIVLQKKSEQLH